MLRVAVIGCGAISGMHLDSAAALPEAELVAVCDIVPEKAKAAAEKYGARAYTDYREMFRQERLDAVHICLPHYLHTPVACEAFRAGIHVLSEKPMSIRYEDAVEAVELAEEKGLQYGVIFQNRYNLPSQAVKERIRDGRLGRVKAARVVVTWRRDDGYYTTSDWRGTWAKEGGGVVINQAIHSIDLAHWMIDDGAPVQVVSSLSNRCHPSIEVEDTADGYVQYANGATLLFYVTNNYRRDEAVEIRLLCEHGSVEMSYDTAQITYHDGREAETVQNQQPKLTSYSGGKDYWGHQHAVQIRQFYRAVLGEEPLELSGREVLNTQKLITDIYRNNDTSLNT